MLIKYNKKILMDEEKFTMNTKEDRNLILKIFTIYGLINWSSLRLAHWHHCTIYTIYKKPF